MKSIGICVLALTLAPTLAMAQTANGTGVGISGSNSQSGAAANNAGIGNSTATGTGVSNSDSRSASGSIAAGNVTNISAPANTTASVNSTVSGTTTSNINSNSRVSGTQTIKSNPSLALGLAAAGLETCLGSASGGLSLAGFGAVGGSTYTDEGCQARLDSRTLWSYGLKGAAVARLCSRADMWRAMPYECEKYWPQGVPLPYGIVVSSPAVGGLPVQALMSANGAEAIRVVDGRDGIEKDCLNYNAGRQKCLHWAGEKPRKRIAHVAPAANVKPKTEAGPAWKKPETETAKVEPKS